MKIFWNRDQVAWESHMYWGKCTNDYNLATVVHTSCIISRCYIMHLLDFWFFVFFLDHNLKLFNDICGIYLLDFWTIFIFFFCISESFLFYHFISIIMFVNKCELIVSIPLEEIQYQHSMWLRITEFIFKLL